MTVTGVVVQVVAGRRAGLGRLSWHEAAVLGLFSCLVVAWFTRRPGLLPGWGDLAPEVLIVVVCILLLYTVQVGAATPAILVLVLLFLIPANPGRPAGPTLIQVNY